MPFNPVNEINDYDLNQCIANAKLDFGVKLFPLSGAIMEGEKVVGYAPYGGMYGVYREDNNMPLSEKTVTKGFSTISHYETFRPGFEQLSEAGYKPYQITSYNNGGQGRIWFYNPEKTQGLPGGHKRYFIVNESSFFDGGGKFKIEYYIMESVCSNLSIWRNVEYSSVASKRTSKFDQRVGSLLSQVNVVFESVVENWQWLNQLAQIKASHQIIKDFTLALHPDTGTNRDGSPNKSAENARNELAGCIFQQAELRNREVTFEDLLQGVTARTTHISPRKADTPENWLNRIQSAKFESLAEAWLMAQVPQLQA